MEPGVHSDRCIQQREGILEAGVATTASFVKGLSVAAEKLLNKGVIGFSH